MFYQPRSQFLPFHNRTKRWSCIVAHRRAGKTVACIADLATAGLSTKKQNARYSYISPFYNQSKQVAWDYLKQYTAELDPKITESELQVELPQTGARIRLYGADNPNALRGVYHDGVILDENADMRPSVWPEIIRPALTDRQGWAVFIGTPKGFNGFYDIYKHAKDSDDWFTLELKASTSGLLNPAELVDARRTMSDEQYEQEFECSFQAALPGAYYGKEIVAAENDGRICPVPIVPGIPVITAWDLGYGDTTAIWFCQIVGKEPRLVDYYETSGVGLDHYVKILKEKNYNYGEIVLPHDAGHGSLRTGTTLVRQLEDMGVKGVIVLPRDDIDPGIQLVRQLIPQLWFDKERCASGIESLRNYQRRWNDERKVFSPSPLHNFASNGADAMRYLAVHLATKKPHVAKKSQDQYALSQGGQSWMG